MKARCGSRRERGGGSVAECHGPDAGKVQASQVRIGAQLAGAAEIHQELNQHGAHLTELARELVNGGKFRGVVFARQEIGAMIGQREREIREDIVQAFCLALGINAGGTSGHGERYAKHLCSFLFGEIGGVLEEVRQPVHLGE